MFIDYRRNYDLVVFGNDFNHPELFNKSFLEMPDTIYWLDGTSHNIGDWEFDPVTGQLVDGKGGKPFNQWRLSSVCQQSPRNGSIQGLEVKMVIRWY